MPNVPNRDPWSGDERRQAPPALPPQPQWSRVSQTGTWVQLGLVMALLSSTAVGMWVASRAITKIDVMNLTVSSVKGDVTLLAKAAQDLTTAVVELRGDLRGQTDQQLDLKSAVAQIERDMQARVIVVTKIESDLTMLKERLTLTDQALKTLEARMLAIEISRAAGDRAPTPSQPRNPDQ